MKSATPLDKTTADWAKIDQAYGGFVVEMSDVNEYKNFADFQKYITDAKLDTTWDAAGKALNLTYASGKDKMECIYKPEYTGGSTDRCFPVRKVNGLWPYLPAGINRDSTCTIQGTTGKLEKNGATLTTETGKMGYLLTDPKSGSYIGINPFPDATFMTMSLPEGVTIEGDGRFGITRIIVQPKNSKISIDYANRDNQNTRDMATALIVFGLKTAPKSEVNGKPVVAVAKMIKDKLAYIIPLTPLSTDAVNTVSDRYLRTSQIISMKDKPNITETLIQDWYVAGPFSNLAQTGFATAYAPEKGNVDLKAVYKGIGDKNINWTHILAAGKPATGPGTINLLNRFGVNENACAYAFTKVISDKDQTVTLFTGSDDTITVWVSGEKVLANEAYRAAVIDSDRVDVKLKKGENSILVKVCQGGGGWEFLMRLGDEYGLPVNGLTYGIPAQ
jgi:hypothetical protein